MYLVLSNHASQLNFVSDVFLNRKVASLRFIIKETVSALQMIAY